MTGLAKPSPIGIETGTVIGTKERTGTKTATKAKAGAGSSLPNALNREGFPKTTPPFLFFSCFFLHKIQVGP